MMGMTKTKFKITEIDDALEEIVRLRLVENWSGCLKLEKFRNKIYISQFPSSNSWTENHETLYEISENEDWSDFAYDLISYDPRNVEIIENVDDYTYVSKKITDKYGDEHIICSKAKMWDEIKYSIMEIIFDQFHESEVLEN